MKIHVVFLSEDLYSHCFCLFRNSEKKNSIKSCSSVVSGFFSSIFSCLGLYNHKNFFFFLTFLSHINFPPLIDRKKSLYRIFLTGNNIGGCGLSNKLVAPFRNTPYFSCFYVFFVDQ
jgi:hypothetical protein